MALKDITKGISQTFKENNPSYKEYMGYVDEINNYRNNIQPMTDFEGNIFRHLAGSAAFGQKHNPFYVNNVGLAKELDDYYNEGKSFQDGLGDLGNNFKGSIIGFTHKNMPRRKLYDYIFNTQVRPYGDFSNSILDYPLRGSVSYDVYIPNKPKASNFLERLLNK